MGGARLAGECAGQLGSLEISSPDHTAASAGGLLIVHYVQFEVCPEPAWHRGPHLYCEGTAAQTAVPGEPLPRDLLLLG